MDKQALNGSATGTSSSDALGYVTLWVHNNILKMYKFQNEVGIDKKY